MIESRSVHCYALWSTRANHQPVPEKQDYLVQRLEDTFESQWSPVSVSLGAELVGDAARASTTNLPTDAAINAVLDISLRRTTVSDVLEQYPTAQVEGRPKIWRLGVLEYADSGTADPKLDLPCSHHSRLFLLQIVMMPPKKHNVKETTVIVIVRSSLTKSDENNKSSTGHSRNTFWPSFVVVYFCHWVSLHAAWWMSSMVMPLLWLRHRDSHIFPHQNSSYTASLLVRFFQTLLEDAWVTRLLPGALGAALLRKSWIGLVTDKV